MRSLGVSKWNIGLKWVQQKLCYFQQVQPNQYREKKVSTREGSWVFVRRRASSRHHINSLFRERPLQQKILRSKLRKKKRGLSGKSESQKEQMEESWYYYNLSVSENGFSLGTDPPTKPQPSFFSISPSTEKFNRPWSRFEIEPSKPYFILQSLFFTLSPALPLPQTNICGTNSYSSPQALIFILSPFSKFGTESCSSQHKEEGWCCEMLYLQIFIFTFIFHFHFQFHFHFSLSLNLIKVEPSGRQTNVSLINTLVLHTFLIITSHSQYIIVLLTLLNTI